MKWNKRFITLAEHISSWSKDPSTQVGCVIVNDKCLVVAMGYNGFPRGVSDTADRLNDRPTKYLMVQHAEANAVLNATGPLDGATAYVTHPPCANCAGLLIQAGVTKVLARHCKPELTEIFAKSFNASVAMFSEAGVDYKVMP